MQNVITSNLLFYQFKSLIPRRTYLWLRWRWAANIRKQINRNRPNLSPTAERPFCGSGWSIHKPLAIVLSHDADWNPDGQVKYISSTFDTDPVEPQCDGVGTIFPFTVSNSRSQSSYIEHSYSLPQEHWLFINRAEAFFDICKQKLDWIAEQSGMAFVITHRFAAAT